MHVHGRCEQPTTMSFLTTKAWKNKLRSYFPKFDQVWYARGFYVTTGSQQSLLVGREKAAADSCFITVCLPADEPTMGGSTTRTAL